MKILLAPSETKKSGGNNSFDIEQLSFHNLNIRTEIVSRYYTIIHNNKTDIIKKMFGLKKDKDIEELLSDISNKTTFKAIQRYTGVAFDYLSYNSLPKDAQAYIDNNVIIFSNLFGIIKAKDLIPNYRLKQGEPIDDIRVERLYREPISKILDEELQNEDILDIRASYYDRFYKPSKRYISLKFLKDSKVVSHWAKAYRGIVLKEVAINDIQTLDEFLKLPIQNLSIKEIQENKKKMEIIYDIQE